MKEITGAMRRVLETLARMPTGHHGLAVTLDQSITTARQGLSKALAVGYTEVTDGTHSLTPKGRAAIGMGFVEAEAEAKPVVQDLADRRVKANLLGAPVTTWKPAPYNHNNQRPGSMDAYKLPSVMLEGRVFP